MEFVPDRPKTQKMCNEAVCRGQHALQFVPDWFVVLQCDVKTLMIMIILLGGAMHIKNESLNKRRTPTHCLASIKMVELVCVRRREKRKRKIVGINVGLFCVW